MNQALFFLSTKYVVFPGEFGIVYRGILEEHREDRTVVQAVALKTLRGNQVCTFLKTFRNS